MGGGNAQKSATARARNEAKKAKAGKGSQLAVNKAAQSIICQVCTRAMDNAAAPHSTCSICFLSAYVHGHLLDRVRSCDTREFQCG